LTRGKFQIVRMAIGIGPASPKRSGVFRTAGHHFVAISCHDLPAHV
jgi:hypothetical protein